MKFTIDNPKAWLTAVLRQMRTTSRRQPLPILANVRITADNEGVEMASTDIDNYAFRRFVEVTVIEPGAALVDRKMLKEIASALKAECQITVELTDDGGRVMFAGFSGARLETLAADLDGWPKEPEMSDGAVTLPFQAPTQDAFKRAASAASKDDARPTLTAVVVDLLDENIGFVGTDSYRLAVVETGLDKTGLEAWTKQWGGSDGKDRPLVPARLAKLLDGFMLGTSVMLLDERHVAVAGQDTTLVMRLVEGLPVGWRKLVEDKVTTTQVTATVAEWRRALTAIAPIAKDDIPMRLVGSAEGVEMMVTARDVGITTCAMAAESNLDFEIAFNARCIGDGISFAEAGGVSKVTLGIDTPLRPAIITVEDGFYLVMPVRV